MNIGQQLKQARSKAGLTQENLAEQIGVSRQSISSWENGRSYPDIINLIALSNLYSLSLDSLIKGDEEMVKVLKEKTDVVKSNKQLVTAFILWAVIYLGIYLLKTIYTVPKIEDLALNIGVMVLGVTILLFQLIKMAKISRFMEKSTSNRDIVRLGIGVGMIASIFITFPIVDLFFDNDAQILMILFGIITVLIVSASVLFKKLSKKK